MDETVQDAVLAHSAAYVHDDTIVSIALSDIQMPYAQDGGMPPGSAKGAAYTCARGVGTGTGSSTSSSPRGLTSSSGSSKTGICCCDLWP